MPDFVQGVRLCMAAVGPQFDVHHPRVLTDDGWAFSTPRQVSFLGRPHEMVLYDKGSRTIALLDDGRRVACRLIGSVDTLAQLSQVRDALIGGLGAVPIDRARGLESLAARMHRDVPQADFANMLIVGGYSVELAAEERPALSHDPSAPPRRAVIVTSFPLPAQFQSQAPTGAAH
jgi:hypothetical protein